MDQRMGALVVGLHRLVGQGARDGRGGGGGGDGRAAGTRRDVKDVQSVVVLVERRLRRRLLSMLLWMISRERGDDGPRRGEAAGRHGCCFSAPGKQKMSGGEVAEQLRRTSPARDDC